MIAARAGLKKVPWDGYLKYFRPSPKLTEKKYASFIKFVIYSIVFSLPPFCTKN